MGSVTERSAGKRAHSVRNWPAQRRPDQGVMRHARVSEFSIEPQRLFELALRILRVLHRVLFLL